MATMNGSYDFTITTVAATQVSGQTDFKVLPLVTQGTPYAERILTYPGGMYTSIVYPKGKNPDRTLNLDNDVLYHIDYIHEKTASDNATYRGPKVLHDIIVTEIWEGGQNRSPMEISFFRQLYNYYVNPPISSGSYITWQPRDRNAHTYNVKIIGLHTGQDKVLEVNPVPGGTLLKGVSVYLVMKIMSVVV